MAEANQERNWAELFQKSKNAFEQQRHTLAVGDKPALSKEAHAEIASKVDKNFAKVIREYLAQLLQFCKTPMDIVAALSGLILSDEVKDIPKNAVPFIGRGVFVAPFFVVEEPEDIKKLLDSVDENGYPQGEVKDYFFKRPNRFGEPVTCAGILSGTELLRVLYENPEITQQIVANHYLQEDLTKLKV